MGTATKIEWTDHTFNPWMGCTKVHAGCTHCYAESFSKRTGKVVWGPSGTRVKTSEANWKLPAKWNKEAAQAGERRRVFCASLADVFEDWRGPVYNHKGQRLYSYVNHNGSAMDGSDGLTMQVLRSWLFALIDATPNLDWLLLTKRPENIARMWPVKHDMRPIFPGAPGKLGEPTPCIVEKSQRSNVWLGTSVSDQETADRMIPELMKCQWLAPVLFISAEPLIGPIDLFECREHHIGDGLPEAGFWHAANCPSFCDYACGGVAYKGKGIDWVIVGGESGHGARPCDINWIRSIVAQCKAASVACFVKQLGAKAFDGQLIHSEDEGNSLDLNDKKGGDWDEWPTDLRVRELPQ